MDLTIPVAIFESKDDNRPTRYDLSWDSLSDRLCKYEERGSKDGRAWSPVTYRPGTTRGKDNVDQVHALVLDIDHNDLPTHLLAGLEYVAHTTFSHASGDPRWRVVLPLTHSVEGEDWPNFWLRANAYFGGCVDPQTKDRSRIFYLPSCMPGALHEAKKQHGLLLDPASLPDVPQYQPPELTSRRNGAIHAVAEDSLVRWANRFAAAKLDELAAMGPNTGRNATCNRVAFLLAGLIADGRHDVQASWVEAQLFDACCRNHLVFEDGERSVLATIHSGLTAGLNRPWSPADREEGWTPAPRLAVPLAVDATTGEVIESAWQTLGELVNATPEHQQSVIHELFYRGRTHWVYSAPGVGKTLFILASLMHVAAGEPFCGREVVQLPVILIEEDSPLSVIAEYVAMLADIYGFDLEAIPFWINRQQGFRLASLESTSSIMDALTSAPQWPGVVAIDACERVLPSDRFSSKELEPLSALLQKLSGMNVASIVIDHTRKNNAQTADSDPLDLLYGGRTKSAISDIMIYFSGKISETARVKFTKFRGQLPGEFDVKFDADGGFKIRTQRRELSETERKIMRALNDVPGAWLTYEEVAREVSMGERSLQRPLVRLTEEGMVERHADLRPARFKATQSGVIFSL